jgi:hypothetical protein
MAKAVTPTPLVLKTRFFEAPAFVPRLDDLAVVGNEQSGGDFGIAEQSLPFGAGARCYR